MKEGEKIFISGPSGCGKSTFLSLLAGLLPVQQGKILIQETPIHTLSQSTLDKFRAQHLGVIYQGYNLIPYLSVLDNILLASRFSGLTEEEAKSRANRLLSKLQMIDLTHKPAEQLSAGQQQRVSIVRALIHSPALILADEPTSALDDENKNSFTEALLEVVSEEKSGLLFVSHDQSLMSHFDRSFDAENLFRSGETA